MIVLPVFSSITLIFFAIFIFVAYSRRRAQRFSWSPLGSFFAEPPDRWEVNRGDMTLLEKLGDGFFGVVHKAYLFHCPNRGLLSRLSILSSQSRNESGSSASEKSVVACKMLKGILASFLSSYQILFIMFIWSRRSLIMCLLWL